MNDLISREDAIKEAYTITVDGESFDVVQVETLEGLPPAEPERKKGEWIFAKTIFDKYGCTVKCPSCHKKWKTYDEIRWKKENKFCPNCGADMRGEKDG